MTSPGGPPRPGPTSTADRPRQLTLAGWFVVVGSVLVVVTAFDGLGRLYSLDNQERVRQVLSEGAGPGLGLSVDQALSMMHVGLVLSGALGAAAAVAGFFVLRRHRGARLLLTALALPLLVTTLLTGGLTGALVVAAIATLWTGPARDWYAGRPVRQPAPRAPRPTPPQQGPGQQDRSGPWTAEGRPTDAPGAPGGSSTPSGSAGAPGSPGTPGPPGLRPDVSDSPAPTQGFGHPAGPGVRAGAGGPGAPAPWGPPAGWAPGDPRAAGTGRPPVGREAGAVPGPVRLACVATWVFAGLAALAHLVFVVVLVADPNGPVDLLVRQPSWQQFQVPRETILPALWVYAIGMVLWSLAACGLAWFAWRRHEWARWLLAISAGAAFLVALTAFPAGLLHQAACVACVWGLFEARAREWFTGRPPG